ncbi:MAG: hypothetical protein ABID35_04515, partial [Candidatus Margulisiibacteriota bacterium]
MRTIIIGFAIILIALSFAPGSFANTISFNPTQVGIGARPLALGKAYVALADDASAIFVNPAGIASFTNLKAISMYSTLISDENYLVLGGTYPFNFGKVGLGYINVASPNIPIYEFIGGIPTLVGYTNYSGGTLLFSYARELNDKVLLGGSLKIFNQGFTGGGATYEATRGSGLDADLGVKYIHSDWLSLGLAAQNLIPMSMGGKFTWASGTEESIPAIFKAGLALDIFGPQGIRKTDGFKLSLLFDYDYVLTGNNTTHLGLEFRPAPVLAIRLGSDNSNLAMGLGYEYAGFTFDYAYRILP